MIHKDFKYLSCTPDGVVFFKNQLLCIIEIKYFDKIANIPVCWKTFTIRK